MNLENTPNSPTTKKPLTKANDFDLDLGEINFKPLSKGIGFHHTEKSYAASKGREIKHSKITAVNAKTNNSDFPEPLKKWVGPEEKRAHVPQELEAFYKTTSDARVKTQASAYISEKPVTAVEATLVSRFFAWIIDLIIIMLVLGMTIGLFWLISGVPLNDFLLILKTKEIFLSLGFIFSCFYLVYFSFMELNQGIGKRILNLEVVTTDQSNLSIKHTFMRSLVGILSFFALFVPMLMKFQDKLSDTKVVKSV